VCLKSEYVVGHNELVKELFILIRGSLQLSVPNTRKSTASSKMMAGADNRNSRMSKKNLMNFRMLEKMGGICGLWNPYEKSCRYPYEAQAKEFTTMFNVSRQSILEVLNQFDDDRRKIMAVLEKEYDLVANALRLPGSKAELMSLRQSGAGESARGSASADADAPADADTEQTANDRMVLIETLGTLDDIQSNMNKVAGAITNVRKDASAMRDIMKTLGYSDDNTQRLRSSFAINSTAKQERQREQIATRQEKARVDEKREIVRNQQQNQNSATAAAIVL